VPGPATTIAALDVDRQNRPALATKARLPNIAFHTTMMAKIRVASSEASIFSIFKILSYVSQVVEHELDTKPSFRSKLRSLPFECNTNAIFYSTSSIFHLNKCYIIEILAGMVS